MLSSAQQARQITVVASEELIGNDGGADRVPVVAGRASGRRYCAILFNNVR
jgi:hypothetical protein